MKLRNVLNLMDHEVWASVEPDTEPKVPKMLVWSADWIMGEYLPENLDKYLNWDADDIYVEMRKDPEYGKRVPMLIIPVTKPVRRRLW